MWYNIPRDPLMSEQIEVLKTVADGLSMSGIPYMVSGSVAMNFYAQPRMTRDIDIVVELVPGDRRRVYAIFTSDFYGDEEDIRESIQGRGMFNLIHRSAMVKVDFIIRKDTPYRREEFGRRRDISLEGAPISVVAPEDLVLSKLDWAKESRSELQLKDARNLIASVTGMDWAYLRRWAAELGIAGLLEEAGKGSHE